MSNEITIVVKGENLSRRALKEPSDDLDKLKANAKAAGVDLDHMAAEFAKAAKETDDLGRKMHEGATFTQVLDEKLVRLREETRRLGEEFNHTGNTDVLRKMFSSQNAEQELEKLRKRIVRVVGEGGDEAGRSFTQRFRDRLLGMHESGKNFAGSFMSGFTSSLKPSLITGAILAAVTFAPGALLAATGLAGIGLGVVGQLSSPAVMQGAQQAGVRIMDALSADTRPFQEPIVNALDTLAGAAEHALGQINFSAASSEVESFASGIGGLVDRMMPGFNKALEAAQPIIDTMAADLPLLGDAVSQMFDDFSQGGRGAQESIHMLMATLAGLALIIGKVVLAVSNLVEHIVAGGERLSWWAAVITANVPIVGAWANGVHNMWVEIQSGSIPTETAGRALHGFGENAKLSANDIAALTDKLNEVTDATSDLAAKIEAKLFGQMMGVDQASIHWHESLNSLKDTLSQNGLAIDRHTHLISENSKAGLENRSAILAAVQANQAIYQSMVAGGISSIDAAKAYDQNTAALRQQLLAAHYTAAQVDDLIGKYANVPDSVNTALAVGGLTDAINGLGNLIAEVHGIDGRKFGFYIVEHYQTDYSDYRRGERGNAHGGITGAATGGIRGALTMVGEQGRELVRLPYGSQVIPHGTTENMMAGVGAGQGRGAGPAQAVVEFVGDLDNVLAQWFMKAQRDGKVKIYSSAVVTA